MKKSMKFATALAGAAVVVVGGTAFTAGNDMMTGATYGYGETAVTGVEVTSQVVNRNAENNAKIDSVVFLAIEPAHVKLTDAAYTAKLQINGDDVADLRVYDCTIVDADYNDVTFVNKISCDTTSPALSAAAMTKIGLTVASDATDD